MGFVPLLTKVAHGGNPQERTFALPILRGAIALREKFPFGKNRTFHWDFADTQHKGVPHLQIHDEKGGIKHIFFEKGAGNPITGGNLNELRSQIERLEGLRSKQ